MKVLLYSDLQEQVEKSGVGKAIHHQMDALDSVGVEYTTDPKDDYDLVHLNTIFPGSIVVAMQAKNDDKPVVYHAHSTEEDFKNSFIGSNMVSGLFKSWIKTCYETGDIILTPTDYSKSLLESYEIQKPIYVVSNGIDLDFWKSTEEEKSEFRKKYNVGGEEKLIISVGLIIKRKGVIDFIEMAKSLPDYKFMWFGNLNLSMVPLDVRTAVEKAPSNLTFPGYISSDELRVAYGASDCYVFPTYEETEGIVLLEALASKANTIIRDIPIYKKWFTNGEDIYKAKNLYEFIDTIEKIVTGELPSLVEHGYKRAEEKSIDKVGEKLKSYYQLALDMKAEEVRERDSKELTFDKVKDKLKTSYDQIINDIIDEYNENKTSEISFEKVGDKLKEMYEKMISERDKENDGIDEN